jgi:hypothetical protein
MAAPCRYRVSSFTEALLDSATALAQSEVAIGA